MISKWPLLSMGGVLRGIAASTYSKYASTPIPCAAEPINKIDAFINQKYQWQTSTIARLKLFVMEIVF